MVSKILNCALAASFIFFSNLLSAQITGLTSCKCTVVIVSDETYDFYKGHEELHSLNIFDSNTGGQPMKIADVKETLHLDGELIVIEKCKKYAMNLSVDPSGTNDDRYSFTKTYRVSECQTELVQVTDSSE